MCQYVLELARIENVPRVVVCSSNHAADWYENLLHTSRMDFVAPDMPPLAEGFYGWAKATYEYLWFLHACGSLGTQREVVMIRIGAPSPLPMEKYQDGDPTVYRRDLGGGISERDMEHCS